MAKDIIFKNVAGNVDSQLLNNATVPRVWTMQNASGTLAHLEDLGFYNVKNYGAVGDGVTNDSTAVQALVDSVAEGSTIFFPRGVYIFNTGITYNKALNIQGTGGRSLIHTNNNIHVFSCNPAGSTYCFYPMFRDFKVSRGSTTTSGSAIRINKTFAARFYNVHVDETYNIFEMYNNVEWVMDSCRFAGWYNAGLLIDHNGIDTDRNDSCVINCQFTALNRHNDYAIYQQNGGGLKITNTKFNAGNNNTIFSDYHYFYMGDDFGSTVTIIDGCSFETWSVSAIKMTAPGGAIQWRNIISNNEFARPQTENGVIIDLNNVHRGLITGNIIDGYPDTTNCTGIKFTDCTDWKFGGNLNFDLGTEYSTHGTCARISKLDETVIVA